MSSAEVSNIPAMDENDTLQTSIPQQEIAQKVETDIIDLPDGENMVPKKSSLSAKMAKNFQKQMKKMASKTEQSWKDMTDGMDKMQKKMAKGKKTDAATPAVTDAE